MTEVDGEVTCAAGGMDISVRMRSLLTEYCDRGPSPQDTRATRTKWGGGWHCALDGSLMSAHDFLLPMCPTCERILPSNTIFQLIEFHQHR